MTDSTTITIGVGALVGILWRVYQFGKSQGKLRSDLNGLGSRVKVEQGQQDKRLRRLELAVLVASKHDPETRRIAEILTGENKEEG
jgi:hypothetical protein